MLLPVSEMFGIAALVALLRQCFARIDAKLLSIDIAIIASVANLKIGGSCSKESILWITFPISTD